ncbi:MAG: ABC-type multidrug transport system fused ATPase/permease subunit [Candidatus Promineifilaceae bacterium]
MTNSFWRILQPYLRRYRRFFILAIVSSMLFNALALTPPLIFRRLVDDVVHPGNWDRLFFFVLLYAMIPLLAQAVQFGNAMILVFLGHRVVAGIQIGMYRKLLRLSMRYHGETPTGGLVTRLMGDVSMIHQLVGGQAIQLVGDLIVFCLAVFIVFSINGLLALMLIGVVTLYVLAYRFFSHRIHAASHAMRTVNDLLVGRLQEALFGVRHVRIYNREADERAMNLQRTAESLEHAFTSGKSAMGLSVTCGVVAGFGSNIIYATSGYCVLHDTMTLGDLLAVNAYTWMALHPALRLTSFAGQFSEIRVSMRRIMEVLDQEPEIRSEPGAPDMHCTDGRVAFRDVTFGYTEEEPLFTGLNLDIEPNTSVALVGHTGCGKTTLTSLLMRFWDLQGGAILIDGIDVRTANLLSLRDVFGVVLQDPALFEGTVAENIAYGRPSASRSEIEDAARAAEVYQFADTLPNGLDTVLGTYGVKLSVGQKQRVSIARAILRNPRILIMDEATSSLDSESEAAIQRAVKRAQAGRTSFVIAHRLSTIVGADLIVVMDQGCIVEQGTHSELMQITDGTYRGLYEELQRAGRGDADA